jgi:hypothetical protein
MHMADDQEPARTGGQRTNRGAHGHIAIHDMTRSTCFGGCAHIIVAKWVFPIVLGFYLIIMPVLMDFSIFGRYWAFLEPKFWEEVGDG